jgi:hypothetical protein
MRSGREGALESEQAQRPSSPQRAQSRAAAERIRKMREGKRLGGISIKEMIAEGRRK